MDCTYLDFDKIQKLDYTFRMEKHDFEGSLILEKLAEIGKVDQFLEAVDADDFTMVRRLLRQAKIDSESIREVEKMMRDPES